MNPVKYLRSLFSPSPALNATGGVAATPRQGRTPSIGASKKGTLYNWSPKRLSSVVESREREDITLRAMDLVENDPHVAGLVKSMSINTVGVGYQPQSTIKADILDISDGKAIDELQSQAEWYYEIWSREADAAGTKHMQDMFLQADNMMLIRGEYLFLTRMI